MHSSQRWLSAALQPTGRGEKNQPTEEEDSVLGGSADPSTHAGQSQLSFGSSFGVLSPQKQKHSLSMLESRSKLVNEMRTETNPGRDRSADPGVAN